LPALLMARQLKGPRISACDASNSDRFHEVDLCTSSDFVGASRHYCLVMDTDFTLASPMLSSKIVQYGHQVAVAVPGARYWVRAMYRGISSINTTAVFTSLQLVTNIHVYSSRRICSAGERQLLFFIVELGKLSYL